MSQEQNEPVALGVCSIIFGVLCSLVGLICGIIGVCRYPQGSKGAQLSRIGLVISIVMMVLGALYQYAM